MNPCRNSSALHSSSNPATDSCRLGFGIRGTLAGMAFKLTLLGFSFGQFRGLGSGGQLLRAWHCRASAAAYARVQGYEIWSRSGLGRRSGTLRHARCGLGRIALRACVFFTRPLFFCRFQTCYTLRSHSAAWGQSGSFAAARFNLCLS